MPEMLTLGQAAKVSGLSKNVILNAIKTGILPAGRKDGWTFQIDPDALQRFAAGTPPVTTPEATPRLGPRVLKERASSATDHDRSPGIAARIWSEIRSRFAA